MMLKNDLAQLVMSMKLSLYGHIVRMKDDRKMKTLMLGEIEGKGMKERPCRERLDDIEKWCEKDICFLNREAQDRERNGGKGEVLRGHLWDFCPWILMMIMMIMLMMMMMIL